MKSFTKFCSFFTSLGIFEKPEETRTVSLHNVVKAHNCTCLVLAYSNYVLFFAGAKWW